MHCLLLYEWIVHKLQEDNGCPRSSSHPVIWVRGCGAGCSRESEYLVCSESYWYLVTGQKTRSGTKCNGETRRADSTLKLVCLVHGCSFRDWRRIFNVRFTRKNEHSSRFSLGTGDRHVQRVLRTLAAFFINTTAREQCCNVIFLCWKFRTRRDSTSLTRRCVFFFGLF